MELKIAQVNAQRSATVASDLRTALMNSDIDIVCIQEPYSADGRVKGYGSKIRVFQPNTNSPMAAILINSPDLDVLQLGTDSSHIVSLQITSTSSRFYLLSAYFQFSHPVEPYLALLEACINSIKRNSGKNEIIIAADVNAMSTTWLSRTTDERGDAIEDFITENNLTVLNQPSTHTTYASSSGTSNIDVTMSTAGMARRICGWHIKPDFTISDHNAIIFTIASSGPERTQINRSDLCFNLKRANWDLLWFNLKRANWEQEIKRSFDISFKERLVALTPRQAVILFNKKLKEICRRILGIRRSFSRAIPWWNAGLTSLRRKVLVECTQLQRTRRLGLTTQVEYAKARYK